MRSDIALLTLGDSGSPIRNPSTAAEDARLASLVSLDGILKQVKVISPFLSLTPIHTCMHMSLCLLVRGKRLHELVATLNRFCFSTGYNEAVFSRNIE